MNISDVQNIAGGGISHAQDIAGLAVAGYRGQWQYIAGIAGKCRKSQENAGTVVIKTAKELQILGI